MKGSTGHPEARSTQSRSTRHRLARAIGLVAAGALAGSVFVGVAYATIPAGSGKIYGCYSTTSSPPGQLRVINTGAGQTCTTGEKELVWNQTSFDYKGGWSSTASYLPGDVVVSSGSSYVALVGNTNVTPAGNAATWGVLAKKGNTGAKGDTGNTGAKGDTGNTGAKGDTGNTGPAGASDPQVLFTNGGISISLHAQSCAIVSLSASGIAVGDTGILAPDASHWPAGIVFSVLRATKAGELPVDVCNPTDSTVSATSVVVTVYRIPG